MIKEASEINESDLKNYSVFYIVVSHISREGERKYNYCLAIEGRFFTIEEIQNWHLEKLGLNKLVWHYFSVDFFYKFADLHEIKAFLGDFKK